VLAENYCELLRSVGIKAIVADVLALDSRRRFSGFTTVYFWLLRKAPWLWRWLYQNWCNVPGIDWWRQWVLPRRFRRTRGLIMTSAPALVISTHPVATAVVDYLKRTDRLKSPLWVAVSDWHTQPFWLFPKVDCYLVPTLEQQLDIERIGVPKSKIVVVGMLLRKAFYEPINRELMRRQLQVPSDVSLIVVMGGGSGWGLERVISDLAGLGAMIIVIAGSAERQGQIQLYWRHQACGQRLEILGFVDPLPYLAAADLVVTKPGGLSTAEALQLRKSLILVEPMPGHEEENCRVLSAFGICCAATSDELIYYARTALDNHDIAGGTSTRIHSVCYDDAPQLVLKSICDALSRTGLMTSKASRSESINDDGFGFLKNVPNIRCTGGRPTDASTITNISGRPL
jgi:processive 1,2-diacylglycerol beta-glucosyltransferase